MAERRSRGEPSAEELAYQRSVLAEVDEELSAQGGDVVRELDARAFISYSKGRKAGLRRHPAEVVLVRDGSGAGFRQVSLDHVDGALDDLAHRTLLTTPSEDRYQKAETAILARLRGR